MNKQQELLPIYERYYEMFKKIEFSKPRENISEPYFIGIPDDWFSSTNRIMIVGEEGRSGKNVPSDIINEMMKWNLKLCREQIANNSTPKTAFWKTAQQIKELKSGISIIWNNIDKTHYLSDANKCALTQKDRIKLHSVEIKILKEEIDFFKPTLIVFLGWHWTSLKMELPATNDELEKGYEKRKNYKCFCDDIPCVFTYHPSASMKNEYAEERIAIIKELLK